MASLQCDVITVPDFGSPRVLFEARTLFFLASWIERVGAPANLRLHLVCLGEPPPSVRELGERAGARLHEGRPPRTAFGATGNKLAGFGIAPTADHLLLVDADAVFLSDPSLPEDFAGSVALALANRPRISTELWREIYGVAGLPFPAERTPCRLHEAGVARFRHSDYPAQADEMVQMVPYYNSGVVFAPWASRFWERWAYYGDLVAAWGRATHPDLRILANSDQTGLALAVSELIGAGQPFLRLPDPWHAILALLQTGRCRTSEIRVLHLIHFLRTLRRTQHLPWKMRQFFRQHGRALSRPHGRLQGGASFWDRVRRFGEIREDCAMARRYIESLYRNWVAPALGLPGNVARRSR